MRHVDVVLQDDVTIPTVYQALPHRHPDSRSHGRAGFAVEGCVALLDPQARAQLDLRDLKHEARADRGIATSTAPALKRRTGFHGNGPSFRGAHSSIKQPATPAALCYLSNL